MAVEEGKLGVRGNEEAFKGGWKELLKGINKTLDAVMRLLGKLPLFYRKLQKVI